MCACVCAWLTFFVLILTLGQRRPSQHRPVERVLQDVDGHDHARLPPAVQREDGQVGGQKARGLLCVCCRPGTTAAAGETEQNRRSSGERSCNKCRRTSLFRARERPRSGDLLDVWSDVVDLGTHLVGDHFAGGRSRICSQHHAILHQMSTNVRPVIKLKVLRRSENKKLL